MELSADDTTTERDWGVPFGLPIIAFRPVWWCGNCGRPMRKYRETGLVWGFPLALERWDHRWCGKNGEPYIYDGETINFTEYKYFLTGYGADSWATHSWDWLTLEAGGRRAGWDCGWCGFVAGYFYSVIYHMVYNRIKISRYESAPSAVSSRSPPSRFQCQPVSRMGRSRIRTISSQEIFIFRKVYGLTVINIRLSIFSAPSMVSPLQG